MVSRYVYRHRYHLHEADIQPQRVCGGRYDHYHKPLTGATVEPETDSTDFWGLTAGDLQSGVSVTGNAITGTLLYQGDTSKALVHDWGAGYFLAVKFGNFSDGLTYEDVQVGLDPSAGSGLVTLDSDCNGVFKISDKDTQVLKVVQSDGTHTLTQTFDLSGLTLAEPPANTVSPTTATYDKNPVGVNHTDKSFTVTPAASGETINELYVMVGETPDPANDYNIPINTDAGGNKTWQLDETSLVGTLNVESMDNIDDGETVTFYFVLTDDSIVPFTVTAEDTTGG